MYIIAEKYNCLKYCVYSAKNSRSVRVVHNIGSAYTFCCISWLDLVLSGVLSAVSEPVQLYPTGGVFGTHWLASPPSVQLGVHSNAGPNQRGEVTMIKFKINLSIYFIFIFNNNTGSYNWTFSVARHLQLCTQPLCIPISSLQLLNGIDENKTYFGQKYARERPSVLQVYFRDKWNYFDVTILCFFVIAVVLSFVPSYTAEEFARVFHAISLVAFFMRILKTFSAIEELGPKLWMISAMVAIKI